VTCIPTTHIPAIPADVAELIALTLLAHSQKGPDRKVGALCPAARTAPAAADLTGQQDHAAVVPRGLDRYGVLYDPSTPFELIFTEAARGWRLGRPDILVAQLDCIAGLSTLTNVTIGVASMDA
jgi:hypothetical protein